MNLQITDEASFYFRSFVVLKLARQPDYPTGNASSCISCFQRLLVSSFAQIVSLFVDHNRPPQNRIFAEKVSHSIGYAILVDSHSVGEQISQIPDVSYEVFWTSVCKLVRVQMRPSSQASFGKVPKLMYVAAVKLARLESQDSELKECGRKLALLMYGHYSPDSRIVVWVENADGRLSLELLFGMRAATTQGADGGSQDGEDGYFINHRYYTASAF